jgi:hypothetical protein
MKQNFFLSFVFLSFLILSNFFLRAQKNEWVNQVIIANGGKFEIQPYTDYVTVESYDPVSLSVSIFDTIYTQSTQDVVINGNIAYVAAQDSIVMYDIDTYQRLAAIADSGISQLYWSQNRIIVTKQYPIKKFFVEILDAGNLALLGFVQGISGDCGEAVMANDLLYVAVDSGYQGTRGKLAIVDPSQNWHLLQEIDLGTDAVGMWNLYNYNNQIISVNKTPYGALDVGSISVYSISGGTFQNQLFDVRLGSGYGIKDNLLYININDGLGSINLDTYQIADTMIRAIPGASGGVVIHSAAVDYLNDRIYLNIGDYSNFGIGVIAALNGDSLGSYTTGLNAEGIAIDYRTPAGNGVFRSDDRILTINPNPATDHITVNLPGDCPVRVIRILDPTGGEVFTMNVNGKVRNLRIPCNKLPSGLYLITVATDNDIFSGKFIRK